MLKSLSIFIFILLSYCCFSQQATLVKDINKDMTNNHPFISLMELNGIVIMTGIDSINGAELWRSDGTEQGTYLLKDIFAGPSSSGPHDFLKSDSIIFFLATDSNKTFLFRTDGTISGTSKIKEITNSVYLHATFHGILFYTLVKYNSITGQNNYELWRSNGTDSGTFQITTPKPSSPAYNFTSGNNYMFFCLDGVLCKTDGSIVGADSIISISNYSVYQSMKCYKNNLYFIKANKLWKTDGTKTNTTIVTSRVDALSIGVDNGNELFFAGSQTGVQNQELWKTDGTDAGTIKVSNFSASGQFNFGYFTKGINSQIFFFVSDSIGKKTLCVSDGSVNGTNQICQIDFKSRWTTAILGGKLIFNNYNASNGEEYWITDGTVSGTRIIKDINPGFGNFTNILDNIVVLGNVLFMTGTDGGSFGYSLWKTDGTVNGTVIVKSQFVRNEGSDIKNINAFNGKVYFSINNELWCSDGTSIGSIKVKSFQIGSTLSIFTSGTDFFTFVLFNSSDTTFLYRSDGTPQGTFELGSYDSRTIYSNRPVSSWKESGIRESVYWNGNIYFPAMKNNQGWALYKTDGTQAGTIKFMDFVSSPMEITPLKDYFTFVAYNLWRSDGTVNGTYAISSGVSAVSLTPAGNELYFVGVDQSHGYELWKTDGTMNGTHLIKDAIPGIGGPFYYCCAPGSYINKFLWNSCGKIYFFGHDSLGNEPWVSDGTENGTGMLKDIIPGSGSSGGSGYPGTGDFIGSGGKTIFIDYDTHGSELWETDGTEAGTMMIKDITPNQNPLYVYFYEPRILFACDTALIFAADDGTHGSEPWIYFPSSGDIHLIQDIAPGNTSSNIYEVTYCEQFLYFKANDGVHGEELWKMSFPFTVNVSDKKDIVVTLNVGGNSSKSKNKLTLYPNPGQGNYILSFPENTLVNDISILNNQGITVKRYLINASSLEVKIDISELSPGIYLLEYSVKEEKDCIKIVKY
jgi:ELWxxDGT repeat protein